MLALFHGPAHPHAVETVENLVIRVPANFVFVVDKAGMDVLFLHEFRKQGVRILQHNGTQPFQLAFLLPENQYPIIIFQAGPDIGNEQFEVLVENRLWRNIEFHQMLLRLFLEGDIQINMFMDQQRGIKLFFPVHIRRIQPHQGIGG